MEQTQRPLPKPIHTPVKRQYEPFRLRHFSLHQQVNAMKVGTDGLALGALASTDHPSPRILDIGSGTSLVTLMLAQKYPQAEVVGIEFNPDAAEEGCKNVLESSFSSRVEIVSDNFILHDFPHKFDLIVSNPPYYPVTEDTPLSDRAVARNLLTLTPETICAKSTRLLTPTGRLTLIMPITPDHIFFRSAEAHELYPSEVIYLIPTPSKPPIRVIATFSRFMISTCSVKYLTIEVSRHHYSPEYKAILTPFLLPEFLR